MTDMNTLTPNLLALYLGCEAEITYQDSETGKTEIGTCELTPGVLMDIALNAKYYQPSEYKSIKPILRKLESATPHLINQIAIKIGMHPFIIADFTRGDKVDISIHQAATILNEFRAAGYDCDNLLKQGKAIEKEA